MAKKSIGAGAFKQRCLALIDQVAERKDEIVITKRGKPIALLVPVPAETRKDVKQVVKEMLEFRDRDGPKLGAKATIRQLIEEGRRS